MIRFRGRITPRVIASRSSATFFPEKSSPRAAAAALSPAWRAPFCACCCRPRAFPPACAARLRAVLLPLEDDLLVPDDFRVLDVERRVEEPDDEALRLRPPDPLAVDFRAPPRAPPEELDDLRALDALDLRALDPPELRALELRELDARDPDEDELDLRALEPRALDPDDFRAPDPPPDDFLRDEPPPLPEPVSAIALPPLKLARRHPLGARGTICPAPR
jgi:hypothetical protein